MKRMGGTLIVALAALGGVGAAAWWGQVGRMPWTDQPVTDMPRLRAPGTELLSRIDESLLVRAASMVDTSEPKPPPDPVQEDSGDLAEQRDQLYRVLVEGLGVGSRELLEVQKVFEASDVLGIGNPKISVHPMSQAECRARRAAVAPALDDAALCGAANMVALYDPEREEPSAARRCIDQYEFPNVPCEYPVVWVRASEAARICHVLGKRLCDAHEWEQACAGQVTPLTDAYDFTRPRLEASYLHNRDRRIVYATGYPPGPETCAVGGQKSAGCIAGGWAECGSNTYPTGAFPGCISPFGVYDQHGNAAEHMNIPRASTELGKEGGSGATEMKGSWFAFGLHHPHPDDCHWRALAWHATELTSPESHRNYHLGFRCCKDLE